MKISVYTEGKEISLKEIENWERETTGGSPFQSQFFNCYGDEKGVSFPKEASYPYQMVGVSRLKNGVIVGEVRHQYRDEDNGFRAKLADEFPAAFPKNRLPRLKQ